MLMEIDSPQDLIDLDSVIEEADCRIIPHVEKAALHGIERVIVYSNDTDVVYLLCYNHHFINAGIKELWLRYGVAEKTRYVPIHTLGTILGQQMCRTLLKTHIISGCDVTRKFGIKAAALKSKPEYYLLNFGESDKMTGFQEAEKYLVQLLQKNS